MFSDFDRRGEASPKQFLARSAEKQGGNGVESVPRVDLFQEIKELR